MNPGHWHMDGGHWTLALGDLRVTADPLRGLTLHPSHAEAVGPLLGVQVVSSTEMAHAIAVAEAGCLPEVVNRQDVLVAQFKPTPSRTVECHARWHVHDTRILDLEVSALTPGLWHGLAVKTASHLPAGDFEIVQTDDPLRPIVICRPSEGDYCYLEMCHPNDGQLFDVTVSGAICFHLFEHDLEKGVILRGRLRGQLLPKEAGANEALTAYGAFLKEKPNLSI